MKDSKGGSRVWNDTAGLGAGQAEVTVLSRANQQTPATPHQGMLILGLRKMPIPPSPCPSFPSPLPLPAPFLFFISPKPQEINCKDVGLSLAPHMSGNSKDKLPTVMRAWLCVFYGKRLITLPGAPQGCHETKMISF